MNMIITSRIAANSPGGPARSKERSRPAVKPVAVKAFGILSVIRSAETEKTSRHEINTANIRILRSEIYKKYCTQQLIFKKLIFIKWDSVEDYPTPDSTDFRRYLCLDNDE